MSKELTDPEQLIVELCEFIILQSKIQKWLIADKDVATDVVRETLEEYFTQSCEFVDDLLLN